MDFGTVILIIALVAIAVVVGVGVTLAVLISRGVLSLVNKSKPKYELAKRNAFKVRAQSTAGPLGDVMKQRIRLQESLEATQRSLAVAQSTRQYTGNLDSIFGTLRQAGTVLENQLLVAQREPDPAVQAAYAQTLGGQVAQVIQTSTGIRSALAAAAAPMTDVDVKDLTRTLEIEATMLKNWSATYTDLGES
ncbi:hypothetical protein [Arthrobacter wenxiniae]|jgi:hypothetical protein|uniref:Secreted protein n=1 Tax=Arthrobacter wenxiniae TaxID=2713570 RepID=A0A7Y7IDP2_9MICC|nr:hypothetical protein [Arthrobacter wenxiniae]NVM93587.1 hypothetical protein [Arthrobacter wenxiniae]